MKRIFGFAALVTVLLGSCHAEAYPTSQQPAEYFAVGYNVLGDRIVLLTNWCGGDGAHKENMHMYGVYDDHRNFLSGGCWEMTDHHDGLIHYFALNGGGWSSWPVSGFHKPNEPQHPITLGAPTPSATPGAPTASSPTPSVRRVLWLHDKFFVLIDNAPLPDGTSMFIAFDGEGRLLGRGSYKMTKDIGYELFDAANNQWVHIPLATEGNMKRDNLRAALDARCRGDSGDDKATQMECHVRDLLDASN